MDKPTISIGSSGVDGNLSDTMLPLPTSMLSSLPTNLAKASQLTAEVEQGNREYKYKLTNLTKDQLRHRISQLAWRLNESLSDDNDGTGRLSNIPISSFQCQVFGIQ